MYRLNEGSIVEDLNRWRKGHVSGIQIKKETGKITAHRGARSRISRCMSPTIAAQDAGKIKRVIATVPRFWLTKHGDQKIF